MRCVPPCEGRSSYRDGENRRTATWYNARRIHQVVCERCLFAMAHHAWRLVLLLGAFNVGSGDLTSTSNESELLNIVDYELSETKQLVSLLQRKAQGLRAVRARCAAMTL